MPFTACTIAIGEQYSALAEVTVPLMSSAIGASVEVVTDGDPWLQKLSLLERFDTDVLFVDVDLVLHSMNWNDWDTSRFCATQFRIVPQCFRPLHRAGHPWFPTGIWYAPASMRPVFSRAREIINSERLTDVTTCLHEEAALNMAIQEMEYGTHVVNSAYNTMIAIGHMLHQEAFGVHFIGHHGDKLARINSYLSSL